jgi:Tfp pilus assembly protein PilF
LKPAGYHLTSLLLHAANAVLVYFLAVRVLRLVREPDEFAFRWRTAFAAALGSLFFALHPLRVEAVAWATGRGDLLVTFFLLICALSYLRANRPDTAGGRWRWLPLAVVAFVAALLSRSLAVMTPFILVLLDWCVLRRVGGETGTWFGRGPRRVWLEKLPFLLLAAPIAIVAPLAKAAAMGTMDLGRHGVIERFAQACYGLVFYGWKTAIPTNLSPIYELRPPINLASPHYLASMLIVPPAAGAVVWLLARGRARGLTAGVLAYGLLLLPVLGFVQSGNQEVADRYSYLPSIPLGLLLAGGLERVLARRDRPSLHRAGIGVLAGAAVITLGIGSWRQCGIWRDTASLWTHAASVSPDSSIALNGRGWVLMQDGRYDEAVSCLREAVAIQPLNQKAHQNLWTTLRRQGKKDQLIEAYKDSIRRCPGFFDAHYGLGNELLHQGAYKEAAEQFRAAIVLRPTDSEALTNLGWVLMRMGDWDQAMRYYLSAVEAGPGNVRARHGLATLLDRQNRRAEAVLHLRAAVAADPAYEPARRLLEDWTSESRASAPATAPNGASAAPPRP